MANTENLALKQAQFDLLQAEFEKQEIIGDYF